MTYITETVIVLVCVTSYVIEHLQIYFTITNHSIYHYSDIINANYYTTQGNQIQKYKHIYAKKTSETQTTTSTVN